MLPCLFHLRIGTQSPQNPARLFDDSGDAAWQGRRPLRAVKKSNRDLNNTCALLSGDSEGLISLLALVGYQKRSNGTSDSSGASS